MGEHSTESLQEDTENLTESSLEVDGEDQVNETSTDHSFETVTEFSDELDGETPQTDQANKADTSHSSAVDALPPEYLPKIHTVAGGNWVSANCEAGEQVIGG